MYILITILFAHLVYWIYLQLEFRRKTSLNKNTLLGYFVHYNDSKLHFHIYIPIRNSKRVRIKEEIEQWLKLPIQAQNQKLRAVALNLKTNRQVRKFEKTYEESFPQLAENIATETRYRILYTQ